ncbi:MULTISPECIES: hypothetical protein [Haloferax]|uniref:Uncharacterized protein n=1 Tax=Haloferax massiliensis TaxID=1476858 RepID=A0A0D6JS17_9EURY|nr:MULTISPECIES: hypothetical protein [Haloferax]MDS0240254.1 hypothetical protein [Haloferax sp. S2CR25]MDS0443375.1 hypothetical protein [Haloferax sp. S2CR25-2]CQR50370.1 hypothetical protein BN996_01850 [Haloferax massiliensis]
MPGEGLLQRARRAAKTGGPPALITAGIGVGATGAVGSRIESQTTPVARGAAQTVGVEPELGPFVLLVAAALVLVVALFVPELFDRRR